jgi:hypothetical protein
LAALLHQIAYDAGCALLYRGPTETARFCTDQYNRIRARIAELAPDLAALFGPLPANATAGQVRIVARALAASIREKAWMEQKKAWAGFLAVAWPCGSLKFNLC